MADTDSKAIHRPLRIAQMASYDGNVGDNANISGTRKLLRENLPYELEFTDVNIYDYFEGFKAFGDEFIEMANSYDLLMIGGGGFFDPADTVTGTKLDMSIELLAQVKTPIVFYALGFDTAKGVKEDRRIRFGEFLDYALSSDRILVSVRNDGSQNHVKNLIGQDVREIPDGGFFTEISDHNHLELPPSDKVIGINLAGDMLDIRFKRMGVKRFEESFGEFIRKYLAEHEDTGIVLIPHIHKDLSMIAGFLSELGFRDKRITVAPYVHGEGSEEYIFDLYSKCDVVMGMRFHANVCPIGLGIPTIGLITYPQIEYLYSGLGLKNAVVVNEEGYRGKLRNMIDDTMANTESIKEQYAQIKVGLLENMREFHNEIAELVAAP